jgi:hypothetical protein
MLAMFEGQFRFNNNNNNNNNNSNSNNNNNNNNNNRFILTAKNGSLVRKTTTGINP